MAKPSAQVLLMQAQKKIRQLEYDNYCLKGFTMQQCMDIAHIALHQEFGFGPVYQRRFERAFRQCFVAYAELCVSDGRDDEEIVYTKECLDRSLAAACGENILPFDERYATERMYFRDSREEWKGEANG